MFVPFLYLSTQTKSIQTSLSFCQTQFTNQKISNNKNRHPGFFYSSLFKNFFENLTFTHLIFGRARFQNIKNF
jgi:hypothetical protein